MYRGEREGEILKLLEQTGFLTVEYLARALHISESSIRRDLGELERRGLVKRSWGGAEISEPAGKTVPFTMRRQENASLKRQIAKKAASLVSAGDVVFLDGSSTSYYLAAELVSVKGILVLTNGLDTAHLLSRYSVRTICTGGDVSEDNRSVLVGSIAEQAIAGMHASLCFFSTQSLDRDGIAYDCYPAEVRLRRLMCENADRSVLLIDSSKLGVKSTFRQCRAQELHSIVCDAPLDSFFDRPLEGVRLIHAQ